MRSRWLLPFHRRRGHLFGAELVVLVHVEECFRQASGVSSSPAADEAMKHDFFVEEGFGGRDKEVEESKYRYSIHWRASAVGCRQKGPACNNVHACCPAIGRR
jgi:hypothetical protein